MASSGGLTVTQAAPLFTAAWQRRYGRTPTAAELESLLAVSRFDGGFGSWPEDSAMWGSKNLGAIQCHRNGEDCSEANPGDSCAPLLTWELVNGERVDQTECFRTYATWDDAADDFLREMTAPKRPKTGAALADGALRSLTKAMREEHYFTADAEKYAQAIWGMAKENAVGLGKEPTVSLDGASNKKWIVAAGVVLGVAWLGGWLR